MKTSIKKLKESLDEAKKQIETDFKKDLNLSELSKVRYINESFISVDCHSFSDFKKSFLNSDPYETSQLINHGSTNHLIKSGFVFNIVNGYCERKLKFEYKMINELKVWVSIDFKNIDNDFKDVFFKKSNRKLYDIESHYVSIPSHYKKFKSIRIESYDFISDTLSWYGGDKTILYTDAFKRMLNKLKK